MAVKRFYETFHPDHYDLYIDVDRAARSFSGKKLYWSTKST